jgi:hypothetical protein
MRVEWWRRYVAIVNACSVLYPHAFQVLLLSVAQHISTRFQGGNQRVEVTSQQHH